MRQIKQFGLIAVLAVLLSGCSIFVKEEITYKLLQPIDAKVQPKVVWKANVGNGVRHYFSHLNPVVVGDTLVAADRDGIVMALDRNTGKTQWRLDLRSEIGQQASTWWRKGEPFRIAGGLTAADGIVYLGTENGDLVALEAATGAIKWHQSIRAEVLSDPAVGGGMVYITGATGEVLALDQATGEPLWRNTTETPSLSLRGTASPTYAQGGVFVGTAGGKLIVLVSENGQPAWETRLAIPTGTTELHRLVDVDTQPIISGRVVYAVAYNGALVSIDAASGQIIWRRDYSSYQNLLHVSGRLFLTDVEDSVSALDAQGGIEIWSNNDYTGRHLTAPVRFKDYIVVGDRHGYLHFINILTGVTEGRLEVGDDVYTAPVVADDTLYVQLRDGTLLAVRM